MGHPTKNPIQHRRRWRTFFWETKQWMQLQGCWGEGAAHLLLDVVLLAGTHGVQDLPHLREHRVVVLQHEGGYKNSNTGQSMQRKPFFNEARSVKEVNILEPVFLSSPCQCPSLCQRQNRDNVKNITKARRWQ